MKKTTLAVTILMALGVTACSSSSDTKYVTDTSAVAAEKAKTTAAETAQAEAEAKAAAAETAQAEAEAKAAAAETAQAEAEARAAAAETAQAEAEAKAATAQAAQAEAEAKVETLTTELSTATATVESLTAQLAAANQKVADLTAQLSSASSSSTDQSAEIAQLKADLSAANSSISDLTSQLATATASVSSLTSDLSAAKSALSATESKLASTEQSLADAQTALSAAQTALSEAKAAQTAAETAQAEAEAKATAAEEAAAAASEEAVKKQQKIDAIYAKANQVSSDTTLAYGTTKYGYIDNANNAELRKTLATEENVKALVTTIESTDDRVQCGSSAQCATYRAEGIRSEGKYDTLTGDIVYNSNNAYTGYAVIREEAYKDSSLSDDTLHASSNKITDSAINSMFYYVKNPTTDKAAVVNATYTGSTNFVVGNAATSISNTNTITLNVSGDTISGGIKKGNYEVDAITFNDGTIAVNSNGVVGFDGTVTFNADPTRGISSSVLSSYTGTYSGVFGGENAEALAGTFETDDKQTAGTYTKSDGTEVVRDPSTTEDSGTRIVQGVFEAEK